MNIENILNKIDLNGYYVFENYLNLDETKELHKKINELISQKPKWLNKKDDSYGYHYYFSPQFLSHDVFNKQFNSIKSTFLSSIIKSIGRKYLGRLWRVETIFYDVKYDSESPITEWHTDHFSHNRRCIKFMLYLNNVDHVNGAFSYIPGSHRLMHILNSSLRNHKDRIESVHLYEDIKKYLLAAVKNRSINEINNDLQKWNSWIKNINKHISSNFISDETYSIPAKAGSLIMFDANGIHRGGIVKSGERNLIRSHCLETKFSEAINSKSEMHMFTKRVLSSLYHGIDGFRF